MKTENEVVANRIAAMQDLLDKKETVVNALFSEVQAREFEAKRFQQKLVETERELEKYQALAKERLQLSEDFCDDLVAHRVWMNRVRALFDELRSLEVLTPEIKEVIDRGARDLFQSSIQVPAPHGDNDGNE